MIKFRPFLRSMLSFANIFQVYLSSWSWGSVTAAKAGHLDQGLLDSYITGKVGSRSGGEGGCCWAKRRAAENMRGGEDVEMAGKKGRRRFALAITWKSSGTIVNEKGNTWYFFTTWDVFACWQACLKSGNFLIRHVSVQSSDLSNKQYRTKKCDW